MPTESLDISLYVLSNGLLRMGKLRSITLTEGPPMPRRGTMRIATAVIVALALLAAPASAQFGGLMKGKRGDDAAKTPRVSDKDYKAALERIPESKEKYDPWGVARPAKPVKPAK